MRIGGRSPVDPKGTVTPRFLTTKRVSKAVSPFLKKKRRDFREFRSNVQLWLNRRQPILRASLFSLIYLK